MTKFILRLCINAIALYLAAIVGVVNALLTPLISILTCPLIILTLGLFTVVINTFLFWLTSVIGQSFGIMLSISDPVWWNAFLGGLVVSVVSVVLTLILKDELKGRKS